MQGGATTTSTYQLQDGSHPQGASNRYDSLSFTGTATETFLKYDDRGNLTYDGRFQYRYDFMNRLQEVWKVNPVAPPVDDAMFAEVEAGAMEGAEEAVKLDVPDIYSRVFREHTDPVFRNRLRATIDGGVLTIVPTPQGGGGRPGWLPDPGNLTLAAVYVYDAFNRRVAAALVDPSVGETQFHVWDGWQQVAQHRLELVGGVWQAPPTKQFVWGAGLDELVSYRRKNGANWETYYLLHGGQNTSVALVANNGSVVERYEYDPYGQVAVYAGTGSVAGSVSSFGLPFLWKGVRLDDITGLLQMRNRHYSPELGRFLTNDPLGVWFDPLNCGNGCSYCFDRPLSVGDPLGLQGFGPSAATIALMYDLLRKAREQNPTTDKGNPGNVGTKREDIYSQAQKDDLGKRLEELNPGAIKVVGPFDSSYNCHGYTSNGGRTWMDEDVERVLSDNYTNVDPDKVQPGNVVAYYAQDGAILHTGVISELASDGNHLVVSKFGSGPLVEHKMLTVPDEYNDNKRGKISIFGGRGTNDIRNPPWITK